MPNSGSMTRIAVVLGSTREGRFGEQPALWVEQYLNTRDGVEVDLIDLRDHPLPLFDAPSTSYTLANYPSDEVSRLSRRIDDADGFILLTPEYNHGYSGVLKNAMDHTFIDWRHKPAAFVSWGNVGGARAIEQLRLVCVEFEMVPLRHAVHILPDVLIASRAHSGYDADVFAPLLPRLDQLTADLIWWAEALTPAREKAPDRPHV